MVALAVSLDAGSIMVGIGALCGGLAALYTAIRTNRKLDEVKNEVVTGNASTSGHLLALQESRRVEEIPEGDRTAKESQHLLEIPTGKK